MAGSRLLTSLEVEAYGTVGCVVSSCQLSQQRDRASVLDGELQAVGNSVCVCLTPSPQEATLDSFYTLS
jgi:hypothetical protein